MEEERDGGRTNSEAIYLTFVNVNKNLKILRAKSHL